MKIKLITAGILLLSSSVSFAQQSTITIDSLVSIVNESLENAQFNLTENGIKISEATLSLETSFSGSGQVGFDLWFLSNSKKWSRANTNTFTITFKEPKPEKTVTKDTKEFALNEDIPLKVVTISTLTDAISKSADMYYSSPVIESLNKDNFTIKLSFRINDESGGGITFELFGLGGSGDANLADGFVHTISLKFVSLK